MIKTKLILLVLILSAQIAWLKAQDQIPHDSLLIYYPFYNDFNDKSGNNSKGEVFGAKLIGENTKACYFDGLDDFIQIKDVEALNKINYLTVSCWVNSFMMKPWDSWISKANTNNSNSQWRIGFSEKLEQQFTIFNSDWTDYIADYKLELRKWYHILYLIDAVHHKVTCYINGIKLKEWEIGNINYSTDPLYIGYQRDDNTFFCGALNELRIYNRLLKEGEIQSLYDNFKIATKSVINEDVSKLYQLTPIKLNLNQTDSSKITYSTDTSRNRTEDYTKLSTKKGEITNLHVNAAYWYNDPLLPQGLKIEYGTFLLTSNVFTDSLITRKIDNFERYANKNLTLKAEGNPSIKARLVGLYPAPSNGFVFKIENDELRKMKMCIPYTLEFKNENNQYKWDILEGVTITQFVSAERPVKYLSPKIAQLYRADNFAVQKFWESIAKIGLPIVEPVPGDTNSIIVTFLYKSKNENLDLELEIAKLEGDTMHFGNRKFKHIANTDMWYITYKFPKYLTLSYRYNLVENNTKTILFDSYNKYCIPSNYKSYNPNISNYQVFSLALDSSKVWFYEKPGIPKGKIDNFWVTSSILNNSRNVIVYTPSGYDSSRKYPVLLCFDGWYAYNKAQIPVIFDNMIHAKEIPPMIVIMVDTRINRNKELGCYRPFADFIALELIPFIAQKYSISRDPGKVILTGNSAGGLVSSYIAFLYPQIVGNVISQSASFWTKKNFLINQFAECPKLPINFYITCGLFIDNEYDNRLMYHTLLNKGYRFHYTEFQGYHDIVWWRKALSDGLKYICSEMYNLPAFIKE